MTLQRMEELWMDPANWTFWSYRCAEDPRPLVPKKLKGAGWTFNAGHPRWVSIFLGMLGKSLAPVLLVTLAVIGMATFMGDSPWTIFISVAAVQISAAYSIWKTIQNCRELADPTRYVS